MKVKIITIQDDLLDLKLILELNNTSLRKFAKKCDIDYSHLSRIAKGALCGEEFYNRINKNLGGMIIPSINLTNK